MAPDISGQDVATQDDSVKNGVGPIVRIRRPLSLYRLHGANLSSRAWPRPQRTREVVHKAKAERYAIEFDRVRGTLVHRLGHRQRCRSKTTICTTTIRGVRASQYRCIG